MIAATLFAKYPKNKRMSYVKKYYDAISKFKINIPTPVMAGVRTPIRQYASCVLVDVDDTLPSIFSSDMAIGNYVAQRADWLQSGKRLPLTEEDVIKALGI